MSPHDLPGATQVAMQNLRRAIVVDRSYRSVIYVASVVWALLVLALDVTVAEHGQSARTILDVLGLHEDFVGATVLVISVAQLARIWTGLPTRWYSWLAHVAIVALWVSSAIAMAIIHRQIPIAGVAAAVSIIGCGLTTMVVGRVERKKNE